MGDRKVQHVYSGSIYGVDIGSDVTRRWAEQRTSGKQDTHLHTSDISLALLHVMIHGLLSSQMKPQVQRLLA